jgi:hypothetical protein
MAPSDSLEYYKLKDELGQLLKDEISKSRENERDLQDRYIGVGLKVAAAGIAASVVTLGVFGIKSFYDVQSAIKGIPKTIDTVVTNEVRARFKDKDPVGEYQTIALESAARAVASSIGAQAQQMRTLSIDERVSDVIVRALADKTIRPATKLSLIDATSTRKIRSISPAIDQAVIALTEQATTEKPVDQKILLRSLNYFSFRTPERFVAEVQKIYDTAGEMSDIRLAIGRYMMALTKDTDDLAKKLEKSDDPNVKYFLHMSNLKVHKTKQVDRELFKMALAGAIDTDSGDQLSLSDLIDHISMIDAADDSTDIVSQLLDSVREYANSKKLWLAVNDDSYDDMGFRFFTPQGKAASAGIDRKHFNTLIGLATDQIKAGLEQSNGEFTDPIKQAIDFWFPRSDSHAGANSRRAGAFSLGDVQKVRFVAVDGTEIAGNTLSNRAVVTTQGTGAETRVVLKWDNEAGETKSMRIGKIVDLDTDSLQQIGIWNRPSGGD